MTEEDFWRSVINGMQIDKDLVGDPEFVTDEIPQDEQPATPEGVLLDKDAAILRFKLDIYVISVQGISKAYMVTGKSQMEDAGIMTVREALKMIERRKKR